MDITSAQCPEPLPGRVGHVAGIESLVLDGRRLWFGFDYQSDMVVSPLIEDPQVMAAFASAYLRQTDGEHDAAYWAELVDAAVTLSGLVPEDVHREFETARLRAELPEPGSHLLYLFDAVAGWDESRSLPAEVREAYERLGFDEDDVNDCVDHCLEAIRGGGAGADECTVVCFHLSAAVPAFPGNWAVIFGPMGERVAKGV